MCCSDTFKLQTSRCIAKRGWMATSAWEQCKVCFSMHFRQTLLECSQLRNNVTFSSDNQFQGSVKTPLHGIYNWRPVGFLCVPYMGTTSSYNCFPSWIAKSELVLCSNTELNVTPRVSSFHIWKAGSVMKPPRHSMANNTLCVSPDDCGFDIIGVFDSLGMKTGWASFFLISQNELLWHLVALDQAKLMRRLPFLKFYPTWKRCHVFLTAFCSY